MEANYLAQVIQQLWYYSEQVSTSSAAYVKARSLTEQLLSWYEKQDLLPEQLLEEVGQRCLPVHPLAISTITGKRILVTGATGCIGQLLIQELLRYQPAQLATLSRRPTPSFSSSGVTHFTADVRDQAQMETVIKAVQPEIVFHLAAERNPDRAEREEVWAATTNILGTYNILSVCERCPNVEQFIFSSTGKSSRFYTEEVYAATKKICEWLLYHSAVRNPHLRIAFVRFTHVIDNSLMLAELERMLGDRRFISLHGPERFITAQSGLEAAQLLINALAFSQAGRCRFLVIRNLPWPVSTLQIALSALKEHHRHTDELLPIRFVGTPQGYSEKFFRGQVDWQTPRHSHLLLNAYESDRTFIDPMELLMISETSWVFEEPINTLVQELKQFPDRTTVRLLLTQCVQACTRSAIEQANPQRTLRILMTGLNPRYLKLDQCQPQDFSWIITTMITAVVGAMEHGKVQIPQADTQRLVEVCDELSLSQLRQRLQARNYLVAS